MKYRLVVLTHGPQFEPLARTLDSFHRCVMPEPNERILVIDGPHEPPVEMMWGSPRVRVDGVQRGFCRATEQCWREWSRDPFKHDPDPLFVFHLEHDFVFKRPVDLRPMARLLQQTAQLFQVQLMRGPVNPTEVAAGGLFESRAGEYEPKVFQDFGTLPVTVTGVEVMNPRSYLTHGSYFTTNPSLMVASRCAYNRWPLSGECEGRYGAELKNRGYEFAVWGDGEPWVEHIGVRTGFGY